MYLGEVTAKLMDSHQCAISEYEAKEHLDVLVGLSSWCRLQTSDFGTLVKVDRAVSVKSVKAAIQTKLSELQ